VTVTLLDGYVLARAAVEASMRYRSAMLLGSFAPLTATAEKLAALERISEHSVPGRWSDVRPPTRKELAGTEVLAMPITEWSVKANQGWPTDEVEDLDRPTWAGVLPLRAATGDLEAAPDLREDLDPPGYLRQVPLPGLQA
jgi:hypothetical protein